MDQFTDQPTPLIKVKNFFTLFFSKKRYWLSALLVLIFASIIMWGTSKPVSIVSDSVKVVDLKQTVLATGQVTSNTNLSLSFNASDTIRTLKVSVGDKVKKGQVLATLENKGKLADLISARGALASAEARYQKILDGASSEEITISEIALRNAQNDFENVKLTQASLVLNAYRALLNSYPEAESNTFSSTETPPTISGTYLGDTEGVISVSIYQGGDGYYFSASGLVSGFGSVNTSIPQPIGTSGLYIKFSSTNTQQSWKINIPNKKASNYLTNYNAYQNALQTQKNALTSSQAIVDQRQAELNLKKASARKADIVSAQADILSAKGRLQSAQSLYENTILSAPTNGTVTKVNIKLGELSQIQREAIVVEDIGKLYLEAYINEANIISIKKGQKIDVSYDAFGPNQHSTLTVSAIDPSSTLVSGVVNYKVKASIDDIENIKPGMTANMTILVGEKDGVLSIPSRAIIEHDGKKFVRVITNPKKQKYIEKEIVTGIEGDGGIVEIVSGVQAGEPIVVLINK